MIARHELANLGVTERREILRALLQSQLDAPRLAPLSYAQEQLWFMDKLQRGAAVYNIPLYVPFTGQLHIGNLERALEVLVARHHMLRTRFELVDDQPMQVVLPSADVELAFEDLSQVPHERRSAALGEALNAEVRRPFDLSAAACVRFKLFRLGSSDHLLSATMHHIMTDAWSLGVFVSELRMAYRAVRDGVEAPLPTLQVEYCDFARWQRAHLRGLRLKRLIDYWAKQLDGAPPVLHLPTDRPRPKDQTFNGTVLGFMFDAALSEQVVVASLQHRMTVFMYLLTCYYALLYRYTGEEDIVVGAPVANRDHPDLEPIIGMFVNTLILRLRIDPAGTFADLLASVQRVCLEAFEHQALPFEKLIEELRVERVQGYPPLYQAVFNFQNAALIDSSNAMAEGEAMERGLPLVHSNTSKVDLNLTVTQNERSISGGIEYNTDLFDQETIETMISHFMRIAEQAVQDPSIPLLELPLTRAASERPSGPPVVAASEDSELFSFEQEVG